MKTFNFRFVQASRTSIAIVVLVTGCSAQALAQRDVFRMPGRAFVVWRLTSDPTERDWANYHNTQCFSPDGRYVCYTRYPAAGTSSVRVFDLLVDKQIVIGDGIHPRWAKHHNWLLLAHYNPEKRTREYPGTEAILIDIDAEKRMVIMEAPGAEALGGTTWDDKWLIGAQRFRRQTPEYRHVRIRLPDGGFEYLTGIKRGSQLLPNPRHPLFFAREDHQGDPFEGTRYFYELDGSNRRLAVPTIQQCHMSWLGNGEYFLLGNGLVRGRKWNEPFPSNVHILASVAVGDISPCGARGRWVCGDSTLADLRSGDGWDTINPLSIICFPASVGDNSGIYDADPKGSPDGTKICFVSNYPLKDGPRTHIVRAAKDSLEVESTDGFPDQGHLVVSREVIAYQRKSETGFEGLQRRMFDTAGVNLREGRIVTSFERRCMTDGQFNSLPRPIAPMTKSIGDVNSPLMRQRMTDVYIVVVRKPDRPWLRKSAQGKGKPACELIPGENHRETRGYVILRDGLAIDREPVKPGATVSLDKAGRYEAVAVEWSGLRSETSNAITLRRNEVPAELSVGDKMPKDFACVSVRWNSDRTLGETVHGYDGVIRREWYEDGIISKRHDLNEKGQATRRIVFNDGAMAVREYFDRNDQCVSRELFGDAGYITEQIRYGADGAEKDHWWFDQGWPIKHRRGNREYTKHADRWGYFKNGQFVDSPRERE